MTPGSRGWSEWEGFVDRFFGLVIHVVNHTAQARSVRLTPEDRDDLCAEIFLEVIRRDFALLRNFRGQSSLATYLTVVARRIVVKELLSQRSAAPLGNGPGRRAVETVPDPQPGPEKRLSDGFFCVWLGNPDEFSPAISGFAFSAPCLGLEM